MEKSGRKGGTREKTQRPGDGGDLLAYEQKQTKGRNACEKEQKPGGGGGGGDLSANEHKKKCSPPRSYE